MYQVCYGTLFFTERIQCWRHTYMIYICFFLLKSQITAPCREHVQPQLTKNYKGHQSTSPPGTSPFGFWYPVPCGLAELSSVSPPRTLGTGRTQSFWPPGTLSTGGTQSFQAPGTLWTGGTQSFWPPGTLWTGGTPYFWPPKVPCGLAGLSPFSPPGTLYRLVGLSPFGYQVTLGL